MSITSVYYSGSGAVLTTTFRDENEDAADPTLVTVTLISPSGESTTFTNDVDEEVVRDATGIYHVEFVFDEAGEWFYIWRGTGAVPAVNQGSIVVRELEG